MLPDRRLLAPLLLAGLTVAVLWPVTGNGFIDLDDARYLGGNPALRHWAAAFFAWHPLHVESVAWAAQLSLSAALPPR